MHRQRIVVVIHQCLALLAVFGVFAASGCGDRSLTIEREQHINTAKNPNGVPLSVDVVAVTPKDLSGAALESNHDLLPGSHITSADWFAKKPTAASMAKKDDRERYRIPYNQIFSYT